MTKSLNIQNRIRRAIVCVAALCAVMAASALELSTYAEHSRLSTGRWVRISVKESGMYMIPTSTLRNWGFDPQRARIYGYGGRRIVDQLSADTYIDDLPPVQAELTERGLVFYGVGTDTWTANYGGYHRENNPYSDVGYYFVTEDDSEAPAFGTTAAGAAEGDCIAKGRAQYEKDLTMGTEFGPLLVGDDMRFNPTLAITLATPGRATGSLEFTLQFLSNISTSAGSLVIAVDGAEGSSTLRLDPTSTSGYAHATLNVLNKMMDVTGGEQLKVGLTFHASTEVSAAKLDYVSVRYPIALELGNGSWMTFMHDGPCSLGGVSDKTRIWDVTDPLAVATVEHNATGGRAIWAPQRSYTHTYVAWDGDANLPAPEYCGTVANQDLHGDTTAPDMVIIITSPLARQAERIAEMHRRDDSMTVSIVDASLIYNEFSSGVADVSGLRKYLKMVYDRGLSGERTLKYVLLLGRATMDHRGVARTTLTAGDATMPIWLVRVPRASVNETDGYGTDDFIAMLGDGSGSDMGLDDLLVSVGRIPMTSDADGALIVDKLYQYVEQSKKTGWKNKMLMVADNGDSGIHLRQTEVMVANMLETDRQQHMIRKVYLDSYTRSQGTYPMARTEMFRTLDEGVAWWMYVGHANDHSWTADGQLTYSDINSMYLRHIPFVVAATCNFLRWDSNNISGGEIMYKERYGGAIGMISATRPVYITDNGYFLSALGRHALDRDSEGRLVTAGDAYRNAKNDIRDNRGRRISNPNRLRFVFMGDPAMRLTTPSNIVKLSTIDGTAVEPDAQVTIAAMADVTITGTVIAPDGTPLTDFDGVVKVELYDAEQSKVTTGEDDINEVFDVDGDRLFMGSAPVKGGEFTLTFAMPEMIADNYRPAALSMYAYATNSNAEAVGINRDFYVYGLHEPEQADEEAPVIDRMLLNHEGFAQGDVVHTSPMVIAHVSDNRGINLSNSGIGRQMTLTLDGLETYSDVSFYYTPDADGSAGGTINYPLESLGEGPHTLRLRVFDTSGNAATASIGFTVADGLAPAIFDVFSDANPASTAANFYVRHDRPEAVTTVEVSVYDLMGRPVWSGSTRGMSDMDLSTPVTWDLTDLAGHRVTRGIYLYRASITADGTKYETVSRRIAVTAP